MKKFAGVIVGLLGGAAVGYAVAKLFTGGEEAAATTEPLALWLKVLLFLSLPLLMLFVIGVHELGHVAAGRWQGFRFFGLTVGPLAWRPDNDGRVRFERNRNLNLAGGVAIMLPEGEENIRRRFSWFAAGGPLASLLLGLIALLPLWLFDPPRFLGDLLLFTGILSAVIFLATIVPFRSGGFASDGMRILTFWRGGPTAEADLAALRTMAHLRAGRPYAALPYEQLTAAAADPAVADQQRTTLDYYRYLYLLDRGDVPAAVTLFDSVMDRLDQYPEGSQGGFYLERALLAARYERDLPKAHAARDRYEPGPVVETYAPLLVDATIADLTEDRAALDELLPALEAALPRSIDQTRATQVRGWIAEWKSV